MNTYDPATHEIESPEQKSPLSPKSPESPKSGEDVHGGRVKWEVPNHYGIAREYRIKQQQEENE